MKATIEISDGLYRRVKAKSAIEGQPVREVVMCLFQGWLGKTDELPADKPALAQSRAAPAWPNWRNATTCLPSAAVSPVAAC